MVQRSMITYSHIGKSG